MKTMQNAIPKIVVLTLLLLPLLAWGQDPAATDGDDAESTETAAVESEVSVGLYYLDDDSYRFGKYSGLTDEGFYGMLDFRIEKRPEWNSGDTKRWRVQGWRLGLDSRRLVFDYNDPVKQTFKADYREIPNNRFSDGQTPYLGAGSSTQTLSDSWVVAPGSNNTRGFLTLQENLADLEVDIKRRWMNLDYNLKLSDSWNMAINYDYISKKGERTIGSIFGSSGGNPRAVVLAAPVDYLTNNVEAMFNYATARMQFGVGMYASFFSNDDKTLAWQNAYGFVSGWAPGVQYPASQGQLALEPDNSYIQFKAYGAFNFTPSTRLSADVSFGQMEQDDALLPYTINPILIVHTPVPLASLDGKVDTSMFNARFTSQLARPLGLAINYHYDDRDNKTPRAVYPYIGGDSQNQRPYDDGRINLPYSYTKQRADAVLTYRIFSGTRLKGGVEYNDTSREYSEVADAEEWAWLAGVKFGGLETASFTFDYRNSSREVDAYIGNTPLIESHLPGAVGEASGKTTRC
jgi:MtrB/PioB family decaheme-associated outer membrane protein